MSCHARQAPMPSEETPTVFITSKLAFSHLYSWNMFLLNALPLVIITASLKMDLSNKISTVTILDEGMLFS